MKKYASYLRTKFNKNLNQAENLRFPGNVSHLSASLAKMMAAKQKGEWLMLDLC